jgi:hypothetical protein
MGLDERRDEPWAMDSSMQTQPQPAIRAIRICADQPHHYQTILGIVRRAANDPTVLERSTRRAQPVQPRPTSIFG